MRMDELFKIGLTDVEKGLEFKQQVKPNVRADFKKVKTPINQNIGANMQSLNKIPAQKSFLDKTTKGLKEFPWKGLTIAAIVVAGIYFLAKIPPKDNSIKRRRIQRRYRL